ncbi:unnamed protein product [Cuscuta campestris]|uniref:RNase H type-1 domain-containing protein n=1 Tax=Cuscuta campestris TaxID=132261 RepID=A0A484N851_9ASTE|nr:unnamed protein product [Cuscuta campestris]
MSVFALPIGTCQRIEGLMNKFWWQSDGKNSSGIHWLSWERMTKPKKFSGLGFTDIHAFNLAMLGKQGWRLLTKTHSLLDKVFKARYYPKSSFLEASTGPNPSFVWRSILGAQPLIKDVIRRRVGNVEGTLIWANPWLWDPSNMRVSTPKPSFCLDFPVSLLLNDSKDSWNELTVRSWFNLANCDRILMVPISPPLQDDWYWPLEVSGCYSIKSAYRKLAGEVANATGFAHWSMLWKLKVPQAVLLREDGSYGGAFSGIVRCPFEARVGEAFAIKEVLSWLKERGVTEVASFFDCSLLIQALNKQQTDDRSYLGVIESECRLLAFLFHRVPDCPYVRKPAALATRSNSEQFEVVSLPIRRFLTELKDNLKKMENGGGQKEVPDNAPEHCPGTQSEDAGKSDACQGCPNQQICATAPKGPDPAFICFVIEFLDV